MADDEIKKYLPLTEATYYILLALVEPLHGYGIMQKVEGLSEATVSIGPGTMYGAFTTLDPEGVTIWWGAYVGMPEETLIHGPLAEVSQEILATRATLRAEHGWIMDIYLLRRGGDV